MDLEKPHMGRQCSVDGKSQELESPIFKEYNEEKTEIEGVCGGELGHRLRRLKQHRESFASGTKISEGQEWRLAGGRMSAGGEELPELLAEQKALGSI